MTAVRFLFQLKEKRRFMFFRGKNSIYRKSLFIITFGYGSLILIFIFAYAFSTYQILDSIRNTNMEPARFFASTLDYRLDYIDRKLLVFNNGTDAVYYNTLFTQADSLSLETSKYMVKKKLYEIVLESDEVVRLFVYVPEADILICDGDVRGLADDVDAFNAWLISYLNSHAQNLPQKWDIYQNDENVFLGHVYQSQGGYIGAFISPSSLFAGIEDMQNALFQIIGDDGRTAYETGNIQISSRSPLSVTLALASADFRIRYLLSPSLILREAKSALLFIPFALLSAVLFLSLAIRQQMHSIVHPIHRLKEAMIQFQSDGQAVHLDNAGIVDEISMLYTTFNEMEQAINDLKIHSYESELEKRKIQNNYLSLQLQPHFYANVMNLIYGMAELRDYEGIQSLSTALAEYFRYLMADSSHSVPISRELECVDAYLRIQNIRYMDKIRFCLEMETELRDEPLLPFSLLTFVENSIKHNITDIRLLAIKVSIHTRKDGLILVIRDNGKGFGDDVLDRLRAHSFLSTEGRHIGILNIIQRMELFYGSRAHIFFQNLPSGGAEVTILIKNGEDIK
jgi:sensor histidine kinase YesM